MSDIILTGRYIHKSADGKKIIVTRVQRHQSNKYSSRFNEIKQMMAEKAMLESKIKKGDHNEETAELKAQAVKD